MDFINSIDSELNVYQDILDKNSCIKYDIVSLNNASNVNKTLNLSIISFNIRSYCKNSDEFLTFLDKITVKFDIIILMETWMKSSILPMMHIQGYTGYHSFC